MTGPGDRDPLPSEILDSLNANPEAELEKNGKVLIEYNAQDTSEESIELPPGIYSYEGSNELMTPHSGSNALARVLEHLENHS